MKFSENPDTEISSVSEIIGESAPQNPSSRRQFLGASALATSALVLGPLSQALAETGAPETPQTSAAPELVLKLNDNPELGKVGGWKIVEVQNEKVIVAHTKNGFVACGAICPHKGCEVGFSAEEEVFVCPCHRARFDTTGKVLRGPAKTPLKAFDAQSALVIGAAKTDEKTPKAP